MQVVVATQVSTKEPKYGLLPVASPMQALKPSWCSQANQARCCHRLRVKVVEVRTAVFGDHRVVRRSRCQRPVVVIEVAEQKLMDQAAGSSHLVDQR
jgi:hypothetical protein